MHEHQNRGPQAHVLDAFEVTGQSPGYCEHCGDDAQDGSHEECRRIIRPAAVTRVEVLGGGRIVLHLGDDARDARVVLPESLARDLRDRLTQALSSAARMRRRDAQWRQSPYRETAKSLLRIGSAR